MERIKSKRREELRARLDQMASDRLREIPRYQERELPRVKALDTWLVRLLRGESIQGKLLGVAITILLYLLPAPLRRSISQIRKQIRNSDMPQTTVKKFLKNVNTWEGISALLGGFGVIIHPDLMVEIVGGVLMIIGALKGWRGKREAEEPEPEA